ncbi:hypothetical protein BP5796_03217 [Coleophoma crateriformis]|uniref:Heterokaryon incompatibility domain-containing protein n=1 Tax=Coleophoma crateriformis TaxID=565419 RepID=A0A3D8SMH2_9HELO|nr:hypothetical protein BP5796_03217 [Coleophoma crateriformis]
MGSVYNSYPLKTPRTVRFLIPKKREGELLSYQFVVESLDQNVRYAALSYVWGDQAKAGSLMLEGEHKGVTRNLLDALKKLDKTLGQDDSCGSEPLPLWIDQLCINQDDLDERGSQVALMGDIYSCAMRVYVCLGDSNTAADAVHVVTNVCDRIRLDAAQYFTIDDIPWISTDELISYNQLNWSAFKEMMLVSWFSRAWVVQEVGLAKHAIVLYGDYHFEWQSLMTVLGWLSYPGSRLRQIHKLSGWTVHQVWVSFDPKRRIQTNHFPAYNFLDLLSHAASRYKATDARDYIFSLLGHPSSKLPLLRAEQQSPLTEPNYTASVGGVFTQFAIAWLERSRKAYLFSCVNHKQLPPLHAGYSSSHTNRLEIPSWCPRWDYLPLGGSRLDVETDKRWYNASASTEFGFRILPENRLEVRAILYDTISETFPALKDLPIPVVVDTKSTRDSICSVSEIETALKLGLLCGRILESMGRQSSSGALKEQSIQDAIFVFASTVHAGDWQGEDVSLHKARQLANFKASLVQAQISYALVEEMAPSFEIPFNLLRACCEWLECSSSSVDDPCGFLQVAETMMDSRTLFLTDQGHIGLGPEIIMPGDICCVISGANAPYIVRPFGSATNLLVGECYVQDIMHGEVIKDYGKSGYEWCDIVLE